MKILHIIDSSGLYGAEMMLLNLMEEQIKMGLEPNLLSIGDSPEKEKPIEAEARRRRLRVIPFRMRPGPNLAGVCKILCFARKEGIELFHSHGYKGNILFGLLPRRIRRIPIVSTIHGYTWVGGFSRMLIYEWLDGLSLHFVDQIVLVNSGMKDHPRLRGFSSQAIEIVENGIPPMHTVDVNNLRSDIIEFAQKGFTIGAIGRLSPEKGFEILLEAMASLVKMGKDLYLLLMGEGALRNVLENKTSALGLKDRVMFTGYVDDARSYMSLFRVFVMSSLTEGLPMVLLEAMAARVPIVATRVGGIPRVLDDGTAGLLIDPGDAESLKQTLISVIDNIESVQSRINLAVQLVQKFYSSRAMAEKYENIYRKLLLKK